MNIVSNLRTTIGLSKVFSISNDSCFFIEGNNIKDKSSFLNEFAKKFKFPETFGFNWDAFSDSMTDLSWLNLDNGLLIVCNNFSKFRNSNPNEWKIANEILLNSMDYWKTQGKQMIIIFS